MNTFASAIFLACLAAASAEHYGPSAKIIQGPSSKTTLVGPEGSVISAVAPGGQIVHEEHPGYIAHASPVVAHAAHVPVVAHAQHVAYTAPVAVGHETHVSKYGSLITHSAPSVYTHSAPVHTYAAPIVYAAHSPVVAHRHHHHDGVVVAGPSGTIATKSLVSPYYGHGLYSAHHGYHGLFH